MSFQEQAAHKSQQPDLYTNSRLLTKSCKPGSNGHDSWPSDGTSVNGVQRLHHTLSS